MYIYGYGLLGRCGPNERRQLVMGNYVYADGAKFLQVAAASGVSLTHMSHMAHDLSKAVTGL